MSSSSSPSPHLPSTPLRRVLIIGGGPSGLAVLKQLLDLPDHFTHVRCYERRSEVGGVWFYEDEVTREMEARRAAGEVEGGMREGLEGFVSKNGRKYWPSPAYPALRGNVPPGILSFSTHPMPTPAPTGADPEAFPTLAETHAYLLDYAAPLRRHIHLNREVVSVRPLPHSGWSVRSRINGEREELEEEWDAVVVGGGWYDNPDFPPVEGFSELPKEKLRHAKYYRGPESFQHKCIIVIGHANSSNDIATHARLNARLPVYRSVRSPSVHAFLPSSDIINVPPLRRVSYDPLTDKISCEFLDGTKLEDVDVIISGTGYNARFPWIKVPRLDGCEGEEEVTPEDLKGAYVPNLHHHIFHAARPTLAFIGLVMPQSPFTFFELQSRVLALVLSRRLSLPHDLLASHRERLAEIDCMNPPKSVRHYHILRFPKEAEYIEELFAWAGEDALRGCKRWDTERDGARLALRPTKERDLLRAEQRRLGALQKEAEKAKEERKAEAAVEGVRIELETARIGAAVKA